ncbi:MULTISPECIES: ATP-binding protein [unclassified Pseudomonas]|uniref:ATP-binding protein n=1 Tax=unclassified Pseudomonas TaxID=196821 RepID=UPI00381C5F41
MKVIRASVSIIGEKSFPLRPCRISSSRKGVTRATRPVIGGAAGLGLGLFIAAEIVASHGGKIQVMSSVEGGTVFEVIMAPSSPAEHSL